MRTRLKRGAVLEEVDDAHSLGVWMLLEPRWVKHDTEERIVWSAIQIVSRGITVGHIAQWFIYDDMRDDSLYRWSFLFEGVD